jgi:hypothetical protein
MVEANIKKDISGRILVSFRYDPLLVAKIKTIEGRRWHPAEKHWSFPNRDDILDKILKVFGDKEVQIGPALKTATSRINDTPSPLAGEGGGEGYNFEDLHRKLLFSLRID